MPALPTVLLLAATLSPVWAASAGAGSWRDAVLLYAPMDGTADAARAGGDAQARLVGPAAFVPGRRGKGLSLPQGAGCSYAVEGNFGREGGTFCAWVSLDRDTKLWDMRQGSWYQWLFGVRDVPADPRNRSDLRVFLDRTLTLQFATSQPTRSEGVIAVPDLRWAARTWHHVGVT